MPDRDTPTTPTTPPPTTTTPPTRDLRLTPNYSTPADRDPAPRVLPLSMGILIIGLAMMLCSPLTALQMRSAPPPPEVEAMPADERPPPPPVRTIDAAAVIVFFCLGTLGTASGVMGLARLEWGRRGMIGFSALTLAYMTLVIGYHLTGGLKNLGAPTGSALGMFFTCTLVTLALMVLILANALLYFMKPEVKRTFRGVRFS